MVAPENAAVQHCAPQKQMKVIFQRWWEAFSTARRNISMGLCIFRTAGGVFEVYAYVCLCVFAYTESRGCVFFGYVDVRMYELGF